MLRLEGAAGQRCLTDGEKVFPLRNVALALGQYSGSILLLASGPSATVFPLCRYTELKVVAMNGSIVGCTQAGITPFYYLCDDPNFIRGRPELALRGVRTATHLAMSLDVLQAIHELDANALDGRDISLLERVNRFEGRPKVSDRAYAWSIRNDSDLLSGFSLLRKKTNRIGFSLNLSKGYFGSRTVPYAALQLAVHLGFRQVFIVGMDLRQGGGRFYESGKHALPSSLDEDFDDYILPSFRLMAKEVVRKTGLKVYNLSAESRLPDAVVPKIGVAEMDELLAR